MNEIPEKDALRLLLDSSEDCVKEFIESVGRGLEKTNKNVLNRLYFYSAVLISGFDMIRALYNDHEDEVIEGLKRRLN